MKPQSVLTANAADADAVIDIIVLAFATDPMARWCWPRSETYLDIMPSFTKAFGGGAFTNDSAYYTDNLSGVALWLPPGVSADEEQMGRIVDDTAPAAIKDDLFQVMETMSGYHPDEPHWYLPLIGVDPAHQGNGIGGMLLQHALQKCDAEQSLAYLESSNPRNISLYQRFGFVPLGEIQVGSSPTLVPMLRRPA